MMGQVSPYIWILGITLPNNNLYKLIQTNAVRTVGIKNSTAPASSDDKHESTCIAHYVLYYY